MISNKISVSTQLYVYNILMDGCYLKIYIGRSLTKIDDFAKFA